MTDKATEKIRFYEIDLLRFLAALSVVFFHYTFRGFAADDMSPFKFPILGEMSKYGYLGVDLFFIISGFVILLTAYNRSPTEFVISRLIRLYPAYWVAVTLSTFIIALFGQPRYSVEVWQYVINLTMIHDIFDIEDVDGVYWSLLVELKFYFLVFLIIIAGQMRSIKYYLGAWLIIVYINKLIGISGYANFFLIPEWAPYFISGALFYLIRIEGPCAYKTMLIILSYILAILNGIDIDNKIEHYNAYFSPIIIVCYITIFYISFIFISLGKTRFVQIKSFVSLGALTYPLYLIHQNIGYIFFRNIPYQEHKHLLLFIIISLVLLGAYLINTNIEKRYSMRFKVFLEGAASRLFGNAVI